MTAETARILFDYCPETGVLSWKTPPRGIEAGSPVKVRFQEGYQRFTTRGLNYSVHRVAWLLMTGEWPKANIDHKDGDRANNRWTNLRDVSTAVNAQNAVAPQSNNVSGMRGVHQTSRSTRWYAQIQVAGKRRNLGAFRTQEEAQAAYLAAKRKLHTECLRLPSQTNEGNHDDI